ncbi:Putative LOC100877332, partial [Caligus rogercresseyi]
VGSVEEFQGQERSVILLSTEGDSSRAVLGFVGDEKRFNDLLIFVGNPHVLAKDPSWKQLIDLCDENHAVNGCDFNWKTQS